MPLSNKKNVITFYDLDGEYGCFRNAYPTEFTYAGKEYTSSEQFFDEQKSLSFGDIETANKIMKLSDNINAIKKYGRTAKNMNDEVLEKIQEHTMLRGVRAKFQQNPDLLEILDSTGTAVIGYCTPTENSELWGIGLSEEDPHHGDVSCWTGENLMGRVLMQTRQQLRQWSAARPDVGLDYVQPDELPETGLWTMTLSEMQKIPSLYQVIRDYLYVLKFVFKTNQGAGFSQEALEEIMTMTSQTPFYEFDRMMRQEGGGGLPQTGFFELSQELANMSHFRQI